MKTKTKKNTTPGLGVFSKLNKDDAQFAKKPRTSFQSPKGKIKIAETLTSEPSFKGGVAFKPLSGGGKIRKYFAG